MEHPVTVGVNNSPESLTAADWGAREALRRDLPLRLLYAWEWLPQHEAAVSMAPGFVEHWPDRMLHQVTEDLRARYPQLRITPDQIEEQPVDALLAAARDAELVVLGSRGLGAVAGFLAGSVALGVVARSERPVVLVRAGELEDDEHLPQAAEVPAQGVRHREVVMGLDLGHPCEPVVEFAFRAAALRAAPLRVIHTWKLPPTVRYAPGADAPALEKREGLAVTATLLPWREKFPDVPVIEELVMGGSAQYLVQAAPSAGLLVVGRWTERPAGGTRIGPVAHAVLHHAACPVAVVPHD